MQRVVKMCREAKALHAGPNRLLSRVHLDHWAVAWTGRKERAITKKKKKKELTLQKKTTAVGQTGKQQRKVHKIPVIPPILSMTEPSTRPEHVSNTRTLLPAWMFASVRIWASVSYRRWLHHTETNRTSNLSALLKTQFWQKKTKKKTCSNKSLTHQIFPGSRPWYIIARMRQDGFRIVTVFSYLGTAQDKNWW